MSPLTLLLQQFTSHSVEAFVDLVATEIGRLGGDAEDAWQTVWSFLGDNHGHEARDNAFAHAVARGYIHRSTT